MCSTRYGGPRDVYENHRIAAKARGRDAVKGWKGSISVSWMVHSKWLYHGETSEPMNLLKGRLLPTTAPIEETATDGWVATDESDWICSCPAGATSSISLHGFLLLQPFFFDIHDARLPNYLVSGSRYARILWKSTTNPPTRAMWRCGESNFLHFPRPKKNLWQFEHASGSKLVLVGGSLNHGEFTKKFANECNLNQLETFPFRLLDCLVILCSWGTNHLSSKSANFSRYTVLRERHVFGTLVL